MADLHVDFLGKRLAGPVVAASGTFGFGPEYADIEDLRLLGGISGKGLTLNGQPGNEGERLLRDALRPDELHRPAEPRCAAFHRPRTARYAPVRHHRLGQPGRPYH